MQFVGTATHEGTGRMVDFHGSWYRHNERAAAWIATLRTDGREPEVVNGIAEVGADDAGTTQRVQEATRGRIQGLTLR